MKITAFSSFISVNKRTFLNPGLTGWGAGSEMGIRGLSKGGGGEEQGGAGCVLWGVWEEWG